MTLLKQQTVGLIMISALIFSASVSAGFVEDSYIVVFQPSLGMTPSLISPPIKANRGKVPFGEHSSKQDKAALSKELGINGEVVAIFDTINAAHIKMSAKEAYRLSLDKRVLYIEQDQWTTGAIQNNPGWALDRLDEQTPVLDNTFNDTPNTGVGRTIYILDSGLALKNANVADEFGDRASVIWDINGGDGDDCYGHGTRVASVAAGNTYGVAKGATVIAAKITSGCTGSALISTSITAFNWLTTNAPAGTIVNWSQGLTNNNCSTSAFNVSLETAIQAAHNVGIIVVVAAGNDGCNTVLYSPTRIPEAFVVGATSSKRIASNAQDEIASFSRVGTNISIFAPGENVLALSHLGTRVTVSGTSFSAPYVAGVFAVDCQTFAPLCDTVTSAAPLYQAFRDTGVLNTVTNIGGTPLSNATSRFVWKQW